MNRKQFAVLITLKMSQVCTVDQNVSNVDKTSCPVTPIEFYTQLCLVANSQQICTFSLLRGNNFYFTFFRTFTRIFSQKLMNIPGLRIEMRQQICSNMMHFSISHPTLFDILNRKFEYNAYKNITFWGLSTCWPTLPLFGKKQ